MATHSLLPKQSVLVFKAKICQSAARCASLQLGRALILKPVCAAVAALCWVYLTPIDGWRMKGGGVVGREPNLKSDPLIFVVCLRGSSAGQVGARALRQEQRGGCMGGWATGGW